MKNILFYISIIFFLLFVGFLSYKNIQKDVPITKEEIKNTFKEALLEEKELPKLDLSGIENENSKPETQENKTGSITLMPPRYSFPQFPITKSISEKESRLIKLDGKLKSATLNVSAVANRWSAVYFYINSREEGGLIDTIRTENESRIISGGIKYQENYTKTFNLKSLNVSNNPQGNIKIPILEILNDNKWHYFIGFVNSEDGILENFSIDYECEGICELKIKKP